MVEALREADSPRSPSGPREKSANQQSQHKEPGLRSALRCPPFSNSWPVDVPLQPSWASDSGLSAKHRELPFAPTVAASSNLAAYHIVLNRTGRPCSGTESSLPSRICCSRDLYMAEKANATGPPAGSRPVARVKTAGNPGFGV